METESTTYQDHCNSCDEITTWLMELDVETLVADTSCMDCGITIGPLC